MFSEQNLQQLKNIQTQAVNLQDALSAITELSRNGESPDNHTLTLLEWGTEKAQVLSMDVDQMIMGASTTEVSASDEEQAAPSAGNLHSDIAQE